MFMKKSEKDFAQKILDKKASYDIRYRLVASID